MDFNQHYRCYFTGVLQWSELDDLWEKVKMHPQKWYIYTVGETPPQKTAEAEMLLQFINETNLLLRREHHYDYCGIVYTNDREKPTLIKIFDPHHLGAVCGSSGTVVLPRWILSQIPPQPIENSDSIRQTHWWQKFFDF